SSARLPRKDQRPPSRGAGYPRAHPADARACAECRTAAESAQPREGPSPAEDVRIPRRLSDDRGRDRRVRKAGRSRPQETPKADARARTHFLAALARPALSGIPCKKKPPPRSQGKGDGGPATPANRNRGG